MVRQLPVLGGGRIRGFWVRVLVTTVASTGFLLFGYDQGVMSALLSADEFFKQFPRISDPSTGTNPNKNTALQGFVVGIYEIGAMIGSLIVLWKGDTIGRRTSVFIGSLIMILGTIIMTSSFSLAQFTVGRIVTGIGNGMNTSSLPMYQSEISKAHNRGKLVLIQGSLIACGIAISYWLDYAFFQIKDNSIQWRFPIAFQAAFALVVVVGILFAPESPRWLIKHGHKAEATKVLAQIDGLGEDHADVVAMAKQLEASIYASEVALGKDFKYSELFTNDKGQNFYRTAIGFLAQAAQQLSGINLITYYATTVFRSVISSDNVARLLAAANGTEYFLASILALWMIDTVGRRKLMMSTAFLMSASMAILAGTVSIVDRTRNPADPLYKTVQPESYVAIVFLFAFNTFFSWGFLGLTWLYPGEVTSIRIRAPASAIATSSNWIFNFLIVMVTPPAFENIQYKTYIIFAVLNLTFIPMIYAFFPETKRRSLEELDVLFARTADPGVAWFNAKHFMTEACYLSLHEPLMNRDELDFELDKYFGSGGGQAGIKSLVPAAEGEAESEKEALQARRDEMTTTPGSLTPVNETQMPSN
ncbi:hypothetical protein OC844_007101 [Tilletia horrida]|nr:hypothetical protein OC844_007101 [Tilletia horrida]